MRKVHLSSFIFPSGRAASQFPTNTRLGEQYEELLNIEHLKQYAHFYVKVKIGGIYHKIIQQRQDDKGSGVTK